MHTLFDIMADKDQCVILGNLWGVKIVNEDFEFHKNMSRFPQIGYCSLFVHRKCKISKEKKKKIKVELHISENKRLLITNRFKFQSILIQLNSLLILRYQKKNIK